MNYNLPNKLWQQVQYLLIKQIMLTLACTELERHKRYEKT